MAGVDQTKGLRLLNSLISKLDVKSDDGQKVKASMEDFTSIFSQAVDLNKDGQIDVGEFSKAADAYYANVDNNNDKSINALDSQLTDEEVGALEDEYSNLYAQVFGEDGASASEISDASAANGASAAAKGKQSDEMTMQDVANMFKPTVTPANTEGMSLSDLESNLALTESQMQAQDQKIKETNQTNEENYLKALEEAAEGDKELADLSKTRQQKEQAVTAQDEVISTLSTEIDNQATIIQSQTDVITACDNTISSPAPTPTYDEEGNITNQGEIDAHNSAVQEAQAQKAEAESAKQDAEQNKLQLEEQKATAEEQKLMLEAEIMEVDKQVQEKTKNNTELSQLAQQLDAYMQSNVEVMSMEADRVQLERNANIYKTAIADAKAKEESVTEQEAYGLADHSKAEKGEDGNYSLNTEYETNVEDVVERNYDIPALVAATGKEKSEVIDILSKQISKSNSLAESGTVYQGTKLNLVDAYAALGVEDKRPEVKEGVKEPEKRDLNEQQIDSVVNLLLGNLKLNGKEISPQEAWKNQDFSQYTPETLAKIADAYEKEISDTGVTFLEMAELNIQVEERFNDVAGSLIAATNSADPSVKQIATKMVNEHIDKALKNDNPKILEAIANAPDEYLDDVKKFIKDSELINKIVESEMENYKELKSKLEETMTKVYISPEMQAKIDALSSTDPAVSKSAWESLDVSDPKAVADLQQAYDSKKAPDDPSFLEKAKEMYGESEMDNILTSLDSIKETVAELETQKINYNGTDTDIKDIVKDLKNDKDFAALKGMSSDDIAKIAKVYGNLEQFEFMLEQQGIVEGSTPYTDIRRAVEANNKAINEQNNKIAYDDKVNEAAKELQEKLKDFVDANARRSAAGLDNLDESEVFAYINQTMNSSDLTAEQKVDVLKGLTENESYKSYVQHYLGDDEAAPTALINEVLSKCTSPEEAVEFANWYNTTLGVESGKDIADVITQGGNIDVIVNLYANADSEQIENLRTTFNLPEIIDSIDSNVAKDAITKLVENSKDSKPTVRVNGEEVELTEAEANEIKDMYVTVDRWYNDGSNTTCDNIIEAYKNGSLTKSTAAWLLQNSGYNVGDLYLDGDVDAENKKIFFSIFE